MKEVHFLFNGWNFQVSAIPFKNYFDINHLRVQTMRIYAKKNFDVASDSKAINTGYFEISANINHCEVNSVSDGFFSRTNVYPGETIIEESRKMIFNFGNSKFYAGALNLDFEYENLTQAYIIEYTISKVLFCVETKFADFNGIIDKCYPVSVLNEKRIGIEWLFKPLIPEYKLLIAKALEAGKLVE